MQLNEKNELLTVKQTNQGEELGKEKSLIGREK